MTLYNKPASGNRAGVGSAWELGLMGIPCMGHLDKTCRVPSQMSMTYLVYSNLPGTRRRKKATTNYTLDHSFLAETELFL